jgi:hypothetical protein
MPAHDINGTRIQTRTQELDDNKRADSEPDNSKRVDNTAGNSRSHDCTNPDDSIHSHRPNHDNSAFFRPLLPESPKTRTPKEQRPASADMISSS